ncbi:calcium/sodium antiporter [Luminiphilus sp.]|nr:calcium/sodium antiporter [Luminiphilus sp.]
MLLGYVAAIVSGLAILVWSADRFVDGASAIAQRAGLTPMLIGLTVVSVGTSSPEILISVMSVLAGSRELAVGNALGSNIANVGLVLGVTLLIAPIALRRSTTFIDLPLLIASVLLTAYLIWDLELSRRDGFYLLGALSLFFLRIAQHVKNPADEGMTPAIPDLSAAKAWLSFGVGLLLLIASSRLLVWSATQIATALGVSELIIGLTIVAVGTSLPELAASVMSAIKGHADMAIGAVVGSNMFNILLVLAIPGLWGNLSLAPEVLSRDLATVFLTTLLLALAALWGWNQSKGCGELKRGAGFVLLTCYIGYYFWLLDSS